MLVLGAERCQSLFCALADDGLGFFVISRWLAEPIGYPSCAAIILPVFPHWYTRCGLLQRQNGHQQLGSCHLDQHVVILIGRHHREDRECIVIS
jgi:hypothetical protein